METLDLEKVLLNNLKNEDWQCKPFLSWTQ